MCTTWKDLISKSKSSTKEYQEGPQLFLPLFSLLTSRDFSEGMALDTSQHSITKEKDKEKDLTRLDDFLP